MWCDRGHQESKSAVNTSKARAVLALTAIVLRTGAIVVSMVESTFPLFLSAGFRRRRARFDAPLEGLERFGPEPIEVVPEGREGVGVERVHAPGAERFVDDEPGVLRT